MNVSVTLILKKVSGRIKGLPFTAAAAIFAAVKRKKRCVKRFISRFCQNKISVPIGMPGSGFTVKLGDWPYNSKAVRIASMRISAGGAVLAVIKRKMKYTNN